MRTVFALCLLAASLELCFGVYTKVTIGGRYQGNTVYAHITSFPNGATPGTMEIVGFPSQSPRDVAEDGICDNDELMISNPDASEPQQKAMNVVNPIVYDVPMGSGPKGFHLKVSFTNLAEANDHP